MEALTTLFVTLLFGLAWQPPALPPVSLDDLATFPSRKTIRAEFCRACDYRSQVWDAITFHTPARGPGMRHYQDVIAAMEWTFAVWDALDDASNVCWGEEGRLTRLDTLRRLIGARAYYHGWMPMIPGD